MTSRARTLIGSTFIASTSILKAVRLLFASILVFGLSTAILYESWQSPFVLDDLTKIMENSDLRTPFEVGNFIYPYSEHTMHFRNDPSRPLTFMIYWVCWKVGGGSPETFHIANTLAHSVNAVLVLLLAYMMSSSLSVAASAGTLFATSPILIGTAAYAYGLSDLLCTTFLLGSLLSLYGNKPRLWLAALLYFLGLMSKQSAIVLPALIFSIDYFTGKFRERKVYATVIAMSAAYLVLRWGYFGGIGDLEGKDQTLPWLEYAKTQGVSILKYTAQVFAPVYLSIDHRPLPNEYSLWIYLLAWAAVAALTVAAVKKRGILGWAWVFFLFCLLPTSSIVPTVDLYVERRAYLPAVSLLIGAVVILWKLVAKRPRIALAVIGIAAAAQSVVAMQRVKVYSDPEKVWQESLALDPDNPRALINLAVYYSAMQKWDESRDLLERLIIQQPENGSLYSKIAYIYHQPSYPGHNVDKALAMYIKGLELYPDNIFALYNLATLHFEQRRYAEAEPLYVRAAELSPQMTRALVAAGQSALAQGKKQAAITYLKRAVTVDPSLEDVKVLLEKIK